MTAVTHVRNALAFLSRIVPPASHDAASLAAAVPYYPLAGAVLGAGATAVAALVPEGHQVAAWLYVLVLAWLTRGLHWDGLADLADACGSNATGERFWEIMKDSRIGAFGVMALVFGIGGQIIAANACIAAERWPALILAPIYGRAMVILFARMTPPHPVSTLGALVYPGARGKAALVSLTLTAILAACILDLAALGLCLLLTAAGIVMATRIANRHGGSNGDFYGAVIIASETALLLAAGMVA